ncbi:MAG: NUDIX domain-containing protein [Patescibacteria group bacterium]|nr:NUDIX domain-containing protein [Patescibacteria group bacterium]
MELIDILDEDGEDTGFVKAKSEVHANGLWHKTAHIWIVNSKNQILLQHRSEKKENYPNYWDISVAGHVSSGEDVEVAALREIKEEIGVDLSVDNLKLIGIIKHKTILNNNTYFNNEFHHIYLVRLDLDINQLKIQAEELCGLKWVSVEELQAMLVNKQANLVPHAEEYVLLLNSI